MLKHIRLDKRFLFYFMVLFFLLILCFWFWNYIYTDYSERNTEIKKIDSIKSEYIIEPNIEIKESAKIKDIDDNLLRKIDFKQLKNRNSEVCSWIYIPKTKIDNYVMQESKVGRYLYDNRNIDRERNKSGSYLIPAHPPDSRGHLHESANILILGHKMNNYNGEWMFSNLADYYKDKKSADYKKYVYLYYPDHSERWRVWCAFHTKSTDDIYRLPYLMGTDEYSNLLSHVGEHADFDFGNKPDKNSKILVLSTCNSLSTMDLKRFVVVYVPDSVYEYSTSSYMHVSDLRNYNKWLDEVHSNLNN